MKTHSHHKFLAVIFLFLVFSSANAAVVQGLYEAEKIVPNQSAEARAEAMKSALIDVLAKISGKPGIGAVPEITPELEKARNYIQQYRYRKIPENSFLSTDAAVGSQIIWIRFDERAVNKLLQKNNLPVWGRTRPQTLVWLAVEQEGARYVVGSNAQEEARFALESAAKRRGISMLLPLMDLEDQQKVTFADVWTNNQEPVFLASQRYQADAILVGQMSLLANDTWQGRWVLYEGGQGLSWNAQSAYLTELVDGGISGSLEILGSRYAQVYDSSSQGSVDIAVIDLQSLDQFAKVSKYLESLEQVKNIFPTHIDHNSVTYRLDIRGNSQGLIQTIKLGNVLAAAGAATVNPGTSGSLQGFESGQQIEIQEAAPTTANVYRLIP
jgi:hypothetical protein